jgi:lipoprotein NlpI
MAKASRGDHDGAIEDYNNAIDLNSENGHAYSNRAHAKRNLGMSLLPQQGTAGGKGTRHLELLESALSDFSRALEIDPSDARTYFGRACTYYVLKEWNQALTDLSRACELDSGEQDYYRIVIWVIRARLKEEQAASVELADYFERKRKGRPEDWAVKIAGHLLGNVSEEELLAAAAAKEAKLDREQRCEAWYYAGMKHLLKGDHTAAADHFEKCLGTQVRDFVEYSLSQAELNALKPKR